MQQGKWGEAANVVSGVRFTEAFYDVRGGQLRPAPNQREKRNITPPQSPLLPKRTWRAGINTCGVMRRAMCASHTSRSFALYIFVIICHYARLPSSITMKPLMLKNVEITGAARLYRAASG